MAADFSADVGRPILLYVTPGTTGTPLRTRTDTVRVGLVGPAGCSFPTPTSLTPSQTGLTNATAVLGLVFVDRARSRSLLGLGAIHL